MNVTVSVRLGWTGNKEIRVRDDARNGSRLESDYEGQVWVRVRVRVRVRARVTLGLTGATTVEARA